MKQNRFMGCGLRIVGDVGEWTSHTIDETNMVNGKPLYYFKNRSNETVPEGAGLVILANCTNMTVENQNISNTTAGIVLAHSHLNTLVNNTLTSNSNHGIAFWGSGNGNNIVGVTCGKNSVSGIRISGEDNTILQSTFVENGVGIELGFRSHNTLIERCVIRDNQGSGIVVGQEVQGTEIHRNNIFNNGGAGYGVTSESAGEPYRVNATENWWGTEYGPEWSYGGKVSGNVEYEPWFEEPVKIEEMDEEESNEGNIEINDILFGTSLAAGILVAVGVIYLSEPLRFTLFKGLSPLYTRLNPDKIEKDIKQQNIRGRIYQYIKDNPGIQLSAIKKEVKVGYGTTVYHLGVLLRERYLRSSVSGNRKFFWVKRDFPGMGDSVLTDIHRKILETLEKFGELSRSEIRKRTGISKSTLGFNIKQLVEMDKVEEETRGRENFCSLKLY